MSVFAPIFPRAAFALVCALWTKRARPPLKSPRNDGRFRHGYDDLPALRPIRFRLQISAGVVTTAYSDFLGSLAPISAGAALLARRMSISGRWVAQGRAAFHGSPTRPPCPGCRGRSVPDHRRDGRDYQRQPKNAAVGLALSTKLIGSSRGEQIFTLLLRSATARALDTALFSAAAGSALRPAGLLAGVTPIAGYGTLAGDLAALTDKIVGNGAGLDIVFITNPAAH